jgi:hypothetical protein
MLRGFDDSSQLRQLPEIEKPAVRELAGFQKNHQVSAAGKRLPRPRFAVHPVERFGQACRRL